MRQAAAFTLVELLVVIGIIALLISILLPSLNSARAAAANVKCMSNLRVLGQAMAIYITDSKGVFPMVNSNKGITVNGSNTTNLAQSVQNNCNWFNALDPYLNRNLKNYDYSGGGSTAASNRNYGLIKQDPIWPSLAGSDLVNVSGKTSARTYKMNAYLGIKADTWAAGENIPTSPIPPLAATVVWTKATRLKRSADIVVLFDSAAPDTVLSTTLPLPDNGDTFEANWCGDESYIGLRHDRKTAANVLMADFHVGHYVQPIQQVTLSKNFPYGSTPGGTDTLRCWYFEYTGADGPARQASTTRNDQQQLIWNYQKLP